MRERLHIHSKDAQKETTLVPDTLQRRAFVVQAKPEQSSAQPQSKAELWENYQRAKRFGHKGENIPVHDPQKTPAIQAKLTINQPGDEYEQEADRVAASVVSRMNAPEVEQREPKSVQRQELPEEEPEQINPESETATVPEEEEERLQTKSLEGAILQRQEIGEEEEKLEAEPQAGTTEEIPEEELQTKLETGATQLQMQSVVQRQSHDKMTAIADLETSIQQARGGGQTIADQVRQPMEQAFGTDFSGVRVHTDGNSDNLNQSIQARAFTTGQDIFFKQGEYNPGSQQGQELLAHELTHVVQQSHGLKQVQRQPNVSQPLKTQDILTVTDAQALLRTPPPDLQPTQEIIPLGTQVEVLQTKQQGKTKYVMVREVLPEKVSTTPKVFGWTAKSNLDKFDLTYATTFGEQENQGKELTTKKSKKPGYEQDTQAKKSFVTVAEAKALDQNFGVVKKGSIKLKPDIWEAAGTVNQQIEVVILGTRISITETTIKGKTKKKKQAYARVMDFDGNEFWIAQPNLKVLGSRMIEQQLVVGSRFDNLKKNPEKYAKVLTALETVYSEKVKALLSSKEFTPNQQQLIQKAQEFLHNPNKPSKPELLVDKRAREDGEMKLNEDLIRRLDLFYKFLYHSQLISGTPTGGYGARSSKKAHHNAMRWTLAPRSGALESTDNKLKFARQLVEINGRDGDGNEWATADQVKRLKTTLENDSSKNQQQEINAVIAEIRNSKQPLATAICAEGYATSDPRRRPNIRPGGISNHCGGEAYDVTFPFVFNYYDPIIDAIALLFGLHRPVKDYSKSPEYWHYERVGVRLGDRGDAEEKIKAPGSQKEVPD
ncbi:DUF4157 domain-containing protein [Pelatocladus sp. BLCC-F211]|uniref:eCIS core domain-containing protein n=1 Tax=Pelatocladus sp. BLCC-F211 TaxID=3342752 RepID=UPI0035BB021F